MLAVGADWRETEYEHTLSQANADASLLFLTTGTPYLMERAQYGRLRRTAAAGLPTRSN